MNPVKRAGRQVYIRSMATFKANPEADASGTFFHGVVIRASLPTVVKKLGEEHIRNYADKTQYEWSFEDGDGNVVTVYDWKNYSSSPNEWHIGAVRKVDALNFVRWFESL